MRAVLGISLFLSLAASEPKDRAPLTPKASPAEEAEWQFEKLVLKDGTVYSGLILAERKAEIEFAEIFRPPGKPMFVVIRPVPPGEVAETVRLEQEERRRLVKRFQQFRNRALIEAGQMEAVTLRRAERGPTTSWTYDGFWFRLESTADERMTRRCVVRVEQIFRAYRQLLPPRIERPSGLRLLLFGSMDEYRGFVREAGFEISHPAFFSATENLVVAGSELNGYARRLGQIQQHNADVRRQYKLLKAAFTERLAAVIDDMKRRGYSEADIEREVKLRGTAWQREYDDALSRLDQAEQQNEARFVEVTQQMFPRLYHEAFHAYVENYVYPEPDISLPRWLNEGLAQIFESGQFDADTLRIDAPDRHRLTQLQADLSGSGVLSVAQILTADPREFLGHHDGSSVDRLYLYSWGLAYYLTFERNLLSPEVLHPYVLNKEHYGPTASFTRLVGMPLTKFEPLWRTAMPELKASQFELKRPSR
jgi:hypothetical protein